MGWVGGKLDEIGLVWIMSERKFYKIFFFMFSPVFLFPIADFSSYGGFGFNGAYRIFFFPFFMNILKMMLCWGQCFAFRIHLF